MTAAKAPPWGEAHRLEAIPRTWELAAELGRAGRYGDAGALLAYLSPMAIAMAEERDFCNALAAAGFDANRIDREVRRVRALAEGRLVREQSERWELRDRLGTVLVSRTLRPDRDHEAAVLGTDTDRRAHVRVTRVRKATR